MLKVDSLHHRHRPYCRKEEKSMAKESCGGKNTGRAHFCVCGLDENQLLHTDAPLPSATQRILLCCRRRSAHTHTTHRFLPCTTHRPLSLTTHRKVGMVKFYIIFTRASLLKTERTRALPARVFDRVRLHSDRDTYAQ